ncbi:MAG: hypothetical protein IT385_17880 [Deltaproteobacteria bacterium]|nr:hypothetical protein [Deltaproteobacteria bacterium]
MLPNLLLALSLAAPPLSPLATELVLVRSRMGPLVRVAPDGALVPLGPSSPRGFGRDAGRLRHLATSTRVGVAVVELASAGGGALFAVPLDGRPPVELATTTALGLDVALSPDGRRLLYEDARTPKVVTLVATAPVPPVVTVATFGPTPPNPLDVRIERPRWRDADTIVYERALTRPEDNRITTTIELAPADGSRPATPLVPPLVTPTGAQDRLAALVGDSALLYRDGVLHRHAPGGAQPAPVRSRHDISVVATTPDGTRAVLALGPRGVTRDNRLAIIDAAGALRELTRDRTTYLDPRLTPDGSSVLWSVSTPGGWVVERVPLDGGPAETIGAAHDAPIEIALTVPGASLVAGCRGDEVVVVDLARADVRALTRAPGQPSCTLRGATPDALVFERKTADDWRLELVPLDPRRAPARAPAGASVASAMAVTGDVVVAQTGWNGVGTIVARALGREVALVPWQHDDVTEPRRTPDGAAVVYRIGAAPAWYATTLAAPGLIVPVTGDAPGVTFVGLTAERLVGWDGKRLLGWRLDGRDARAPAVILADVAWPGPFVPDHARVTAVTSARALVSAPAIPGAAPTTLLEGVWPRSLAYDRRGSRVIASAMYESQLTILSVDVLGRDGDRPRVLGHPRPPAGSDLAFGVGLGDIDVLPSGDVALRYVTTTTAAPHPAGFDVLAANGSGYRTREAARVIMAPPLAPAADDTGLADAEWSGAEIRAPIR